MDRPTLPKAPPSPPQRSHERAERTPPRRTALHSPVARENTAAVVASAAQRRLSRAATRCRRDMATPTPAAAAPPGAVPAGQATPIPAPPAAPRARTAPDAGACATVASGAAGRRAANPPQEP